MLIVPLLAPGQEVAVGVIVAARLLVWFTVRLTVLVHPPDASVTTTTWGPAGTLLNTIGLFPDWVTVPLSTKVYGAVPTPAGTVTVIVPDGGPQVAFVALAVALRVLVRVTVMVSAVAIVVPGPVQAENDVTIRYCVFPGGGQTFGKLKSSSPAVVVAVSAVEIKVPDMLNNWEPRYLEPPPDGVNLYPVLDSLHAVQFLPGAATAWFLAQFCRPRIASPWFQLLQRGLFPIKTSTIPVFSFNTICCVHNNVLQEDPNMGTEK